MASLDQPHDGAMAFQRKQSFNNIEGREGDQDQLDSSMISLQEEIEIEEIALKALLDRRSKIAQHLVSEQQKLSHLRAQGSSLNDRKSTLQAAHEKHTSLRAKLEESLQTSREKLSKLEKIEAVAENSHAEEKPATTSTSVEYVVSEASDDISENDGTTDDERASRQNSESIEEADETAVLRVPILDVLALQNQFPEKYRSKNIQSNTGFFSFLPMMDSVVVSRIMRHYQMEAADLDQSIPKNPNTNYSSSADNDQEFSNPDRAVWESTMRRSLLCNTCLDLLLLRSSTGSSTDADSNDRQTSLASPAVALSPSNTVSNTPFKVKETKTAMDPNIPLCPYELAGVCADEYCPYQHTDANRKRAPILPRELLPLPSLNLNITSGVEDAKASARTEPVEPTRKLNASPAAENPASSEPTEGSDHVDNVDEYGISEADEEFIALPEIDHDDMDIAETDSSDDEFENAGVVESFLQSNQKNTSPFWWTNQEIDPFSATSLPLEDVLQMIGGTKIIGENALQLEISLPASGSSRPEWIAWLGRIVDFCRVATHAGRHELVLAMLDGASTLTTLPPDELVIHDTDRTSPRSTIQDTAPPRVPVAQSLRDHKLDHVISFLHKIRLAAYQRDTLRSSVFEHAFVIQISFAIVSQYLEALWQSENNTNSRESAEKGDSQTTSTVVHETIELLIGNVHLAPSEGGVIELIQKVKRLFDPENTTKDQTADASLQAIKPLVQWSLSTLRTDSRTLLSIPTNRLEDQLVKPILAFVSTNLRKSHIRNTRTQCQSLEYIKGITLIGFVTLACLEKFATHASRGKGFMSASLTAALTSLDSSIHQLLKILGKNVSEVSHLLNLALTPLVAASISSASFLKQYSNAQNRLTMVMFRNQLSRSKWIQYSELLWSQLIHLRMSLPVDSHVDEPSGNLLSESRGTENKSLVSLMKTLGVRLHHMSLVGDLNLMKAGQSPEQEVSEASNAMEVTRRLILHQEGEKLTPGSTTIDMNNTNLCQQIGEDRMEAMASTLPRSMLLANRCTKLSLQNCRLTGLPSSFGLELSNVITLDLSRNLLDRLPLSIAFMGNLEELHLYHNMLTILPDLPGSNLRLLNVSHNRLSKFPSFLLQNGANGKSRDISTNSPKRKRRKTRMGIIDTPSSFQKLEELMLSHNRLDPMDVLHYKLILNLKCLRILEIEPQDWAKT